jgi:hypothetical protein
VAEGEAPPVEPPAPEEPAPAAEASAETEVAAPAQEPNGTA